MNSTNNPYPTLRLAVQSEFYLTPDSSFKGQLLALTILLGVSTACLVLSLALRWYHGAFWTVRLQHTVAGTWIAVHPMIGWIFFSTVFLGLAQVYLWQTMLYGEAGSDLHNTILWRSTVWLALWLAAWMTAWATALAPILSRQPSPSTRFDVAHYPWLANIFFLLIPCITFGVIIWLSLIASNHYNTAFRLYRLVDAALVKASAAWEAGIAVDTSRMAAVRLELKRDAGLIIESWRLVWVAWSAFVALELAVFFFACVAHFRSLGISMRTLRARTSTGSSYQRQMRSLVWGYRSLVFTIVIILIIAAAYLATTITLAIKTAEIAHPGRLAEIAAIGALYVYAVFGGLGNFVVLLRSFVRPPKANASNIPLSTVGLSRPHDGATSFGAGSRTQLTMMRSVEVQSDHSQFDVDLEPVGREGDAKAEGPWAYAR